MKGCVGAPPFMIQAGQCGSVRLGAPIPTLDPNCNQPKIGGCTRTRSIFNTKAIRKSQLSFSRNKRIKVDFSPREDVMKSVCYLKSTSPLSVSRGLINPHT